MKLVGELIPWGPNAEFGSSVVDAARNVAYMGSLAPDHGVAVIDITNRANPVFVNELPPVVFNPPNALTTSDGLDLVGRYLLVAHHQEGSSGFGGVSVWDISSDPFHPVHLRDIVVAPGCGPESAYLDPEVESGRPGHSVTFTTRRQGPVSLSIFDAAGRSVAIVNASFVSSGTHTLTWDGRNAAGHRSPSGVYLARLATSEGSASMKLVHLAP